MGCQVAVVAILVGTNNVLLPAWHLEMKSMAFLQAIKNLYLLSKLYYCNIVKKAFRSSNMFKFLEVRGGGIVSVSYYLISMRDVGFYKFSVLGLCCSKMFWKYELWFGIGSSLELFRQLIKLFIDKKLFNKSKKLSTTFLSDKKFR